MDALAKQDRRALRAVWILVAADLLLTGPFVFRGPADGDTIRYALGISRWSSGELSLRGLFNAEMSFAWYALGRFIAFVAGAGLSALPVLLNFTSWIFGAAATGLLHLWWRRWFGAPVALRLSALLLFSPAWWSLHLYGNPNIAGLAVAAAALVTLPAEDPTMGARARRLRYVAASAIGAAALCVRADLLMLVPAIAAWALWGVERPAGRKLLLWGGACIAGFLLIRTLAVGVPAAGGTVGRHLHSNLALGSWNWLRGNLAALVSSGPPLVTLASLAALATQGGGAGRMRGSFLLWILPAVLFCAFARVQLTRILIPVLPALFLPLAWWAASRAPRADRRLAGLVVAAQLVMIPVPGLLERAGLRNPMGRRTNHYLFLGNMISDHAIISRIADETLRDGERLPEDAPGRPPTLVVGEDVIYYEFLLQSRIPDLRVRTLGADYLVRLQEATDPASGRRWLLLARGRGGEPEQFLSKFGCPEPARVHQTPEDVRHFGKAIGEEAG